MRICVVTATRAEYGLLVWPMREMAGRGLDVQVVVTGAHLAPQFGDTWRAIEADGFPIAAKVDMLLAADSPAAVTKSLGVALLGLADAFQRLAPDAVMVLGDRYELLAVASAALLARIPLLHIGGGEVTEGALDDSVRHAVTKMAHWHFTNTEIARRRILQMGEAPERVHCVGAPGLDHLRRLDLLDRDALSARLGFDLGGDFVLVTYHPVTLGQGDPTAGIDALLAGLESRPEVKAVITGVNADPGHAAIDARLRAFAAAHPDRVHLAASLGQLNYLSAMTLCRAVVGNSSSGIIEAPSAGVPTVNLGDRQKGRERAASVIDCAETAEAVARALDRALSPDFAALARQVVNPHGDGRTSQRIADIVQALPPGPAGPKGFVDPAPISPRPDEPW